MTDSPKGTPLRVPSPEETAAAHAAMATRRASITARNAELPKIRELGEAALRRLLPVAQRDTGQAGVVARFLLNLYNGDRFPFDNTDLRRLDYELFDDCMAVLRMDFQPYQEVHNYFLDGGKVWAALAENWGVRDFHGDNWRSAEYRRGEEVEYCRDGKWLVGRFVAVDLDNLVLVQDRIFGGNVLPFPSDSVRRKETA